MVHKNRHFIAGSSLLTLMLVSTALAAEKRPLADVEMKVLLGKGLQVRSTDLQAGKLFTAQMIASGIPIRRPATMAKSINSREMGSRSVTAWNTVWPVRNERPKSPCSTWPSQPK